MLDTTEPVTTTHEVRNFVGGAFVESGADTRFDLVDPTTEQVYGTSPVSTATDVDAAFTSASTAFATCA